MAEQAGLDHPARMQALLGRSRWNADALRDHVRAYALEALGDPDPPGPPRLPAADPDSLHSQRVARAKAPSSPSSPRPLQAAAICAAVVLGEHQEATNETALEVTREWMELAQDGLQRNSTLLTELVQAKSAQTATGIQTRIVSANMGALMKDSARLAEALAKASEEAIARLSTILDVQVRAQGRAAQLRERKRILKEP